MHGAEQVARRGPQDRAGDRAAARGAQHQQVGVALGGDLAQPVLGPALDGVADHAELGRGGRVGGQGELLQVGRRVERGRRTRGARSVSHVDEVQLRVVARRQANRGDQGGVVGLQGRDAGDDAMDQGTRGFLPARAGCGAP